MATNLFNAALQNPAVMAQISSAVEQTAGSIDSPEEAQALVARAASNPELKSNLQTKLQAVASEYGLTLDLASLITVGSAAAGEAFALGGIMKFKAHPQTPAQLEFAAAAAIFAPTLFT